MKCRFRVEPPAPYSLALTAQRYARFPDPVDRFDGQAYRRLIPAGRGTVLVTVEQAGGADDPNLRVTVEGAAASSKAAEAAVRNLVGGALGAAADLRQFYRVAATRPTSRSPRPAIPRAPHRRVSLAVEALVDRGARAGRSTWPLRSLSARTFPVAFGRKARLRGGTFTAFPTPKRVGARGRGGLAGSAVEEQDLDSRAARDGVSRVASSRRTESRFSRTRRPSSGSRR